MYMDGHSAYDIQLRGDWKSQTLLTYIRARTHLVRANSLSIAVRAVSANAPSGFLPAHPSFR